MKGPIERSTIDLARTSIVVLGNLNLAASVPKIFHFQNDLFFFFDFFLLKPVAQPSLFSVTLLSVDKY